jgi:hypothetical protein
MENEGDFYVELEHCKKRALAIINLYVKDEMISHIVGITKPTIMCQTQTKIILSKKFKLVNFYGDQFYQ